jgi:serine/threonine protein kinase
MEPKRPRLVHPMRSQDRSPTPDDFDLALRELARPPGLGDAFAANVGLQATHPLAPVVETAVRQVQSPATPRTGDVLEGRYKVLSVLGRGGMGVVLEAEQVRTKKVVAIKWMHGARDAERTPSQVARFQREARAVANIQHPNVVDLYDVGESDGTPFLVLERLRGESLRERLTRGAMSWDEATSVMLGVLAGVGAVHRSGVIHRDLKPDNIFLCHDDGKLTPKVLDFGVAAIRAKGADGLDSLTRTGAVLGTPAYMPLEQLTGGEVDARADIYALGVMLYEMVTMRLPFEARTAADLAVLQVTRSPAPPSHLARSLSKGQEQVILNALSSQREKRYLDTDAFANALSSGAPSPTRGRLIQLALTLGLAASVGVFVLGNLRTSPTTGDEKTGSLVAAPRSTPLGCRRRPSYGA